MAYSNVKVQFEIGHEASVRNKRTPEGFTHDWEVFVRGVDNADINHFVDKVVFHLHETFPKPKRILKDKPFVVKESGYAGFTLPIDVYLKNKDEPRKIKFNYDLALQPGGPPIKNVTREKYVFSNPSEDFRRKLIRGGGVGVLGSETNSTTSTATDKDTPSKPLPASTSSSSSKKSSEPPPSSSSIIKKPKIKDSVRLEDMRGDNSFQALFGTPIKKTTPVVQPKSSAPKTDKPKTSSTTTGSSEKHSSGSSTEKQAKSSSGSSTHSPHKNKDKEFSSTAQSISTPSPAVTNPASNISTSSSSSKKDKIKEKVVPKEKEKSSSSVRDKFKEKDKDKGDKEKKDVKTSSSEKEKKKDKKEKKEKSHKHKDKDRDRDREKEEIKEKEKREPKDVNSNKLSGNKPVVSSHAKESTGSVTISSVKSPSRTKEKDKESSHDKSDKHGKHKHKKKDKHSSKEKETKDKESLSKSKESVSKGNTRNRTPSLSPRASLHPPQIPPIILQKSPPITGGPTKKPSYTLIENPSDKSELSDNDNDDRFSKASSVPPRLKMPTSPRSSLSRSPSPIKSRSPSPVLKKEIKKDKELTKATKKVKKSKESSDKKKKRKLKDLSDSEDSESEDVKSKLKNKKSKQTVEKTIQETSGSLVKAKDEDVGKLKHENLDKDDRSQSPSVSSTRTLFRCKSESRSRSRSISPMSKSRSVSKSKSRSPSRSKSRSHSRSLSRSRSRSPLACSPVGRSPDVSPDVSPERSSASPDRDRNTSSVTEEPSSTSSAGPSNQFSHNYIDELKDLQEKIMTLEDNNELQRIVKIIAETGKYEITKKTFDFDLCSLEPTTIKKLQHVFAPNDSS